MTETIATKPVRAGERIQTFWCEDCREWHKASVLGGVILNEDDDSEGRSDDNDSDN